MTKQNSVSRRNFLGTTAAVAGAFATSPLIVSGNDAPSRRVRIGIMGAQRGLALAEAFAVQPGVEIKYISDVDPKRADLARQKLEKDHDQKPQPINDFRQILDDKEIDIFVCAAPNHWHAPAAILACAAGKHVYGEKPASHNPWEGEAMIAAARKHNRLVQIGTQRRSTDGFIEAIQKLHDGIIGNVYASRSWYDNLRASIGKAGPGNAPEGLDYELWQGPAPRQEYHPNRIHYNWHWFWDYGNGELGNNGIHSLDISRWGLQVDYPTQVVSTGGRYRYDDDQQTPDTNIATYEFADGKQISWLGMSCNRNRDSDAFVSFYGEKGAVHLTTHGVYKILDTNDKLIEESPSVANDPNRWRRMEQQHIANLISAVREENGAKLNCDVEEGHKSTLLCHLGNIAYRTKRSLSCDAQNGHIQNDDDAMKLWQRDYADGWKPVV